MPSPKRQLGDIGEKIARNYLKRKGYNILENNYRKKYGEVDIVAKDRKVLVFVEVKTRIKKLTEKYLPPETNVNYSKGIKIIRTAQVYLMERRIPEDIFWRIDVISVELNYESRKATVKHFQNAVVV